MQSPQRSQKLHDRWRRAGHGLECATPTNQTIVSAFCERPGNSRLSQEDVLANHTYSITEIAGSSEISHPDAIERAVKRASRRFGIWHGLR
jgi:hypothetical protein